jgi:hypothetical protein
VFPIVLSAVEAESSSSVGAGFKAVPPLLFWRTAAAAWWSWIGEGCRNKGGRGREAEAGEVSVVDSWRGVNVAGFDRVDKLFVDRAFFLMRLPPRFEVAKIHSRFSFRHRAHGGWPPEASLRIRPSATYKRKINYFAEGGYCGS